MSQQLTISSLFSALALIALALTARVSDLAEAHAIDPALVQINEAANLDA